jgi:hypothetical protein
MKFLQGRGSKIMRPVFMGRSVTMISVFVLTFGFFSCKKKDESNGPAGEKGSAGIHESWGRGPVTVKLDADRKEITIADRLTLKITVISDEDDEIELPAFGAELDQFGIVDYHTTGPELMGEGKKKIGRSYILEPFLSGDYTIPPMKIRFREPDKAGGESHEIMTEKISIKVKSLLPGDRKKMKLHEISPPMDLPRSAALWVWIGIGGCILAVAGTTGFIIVRKKRRASDRSEPKIPAHELAFAELERLVSEDLARKGEIKSFYQRISDILRHYIENRFGINAPEQTTEEFLTGLRSRKDFSKDHNTLLKNFLHHCDLVKFAEHQPRTEDIQNTFDSCRDFIAGTAISEAE